jgi:uncharacterized membrane protein
VSWTRQRIALVAIACASGLAMLYVGLFQVGWVYRLACPGFGSGCESVALAPFAWPFGLADGLLGAAICGILCALAMVPRREAGIALIGVAAAWVIVNLVALADMQKLGAFCFWCTLSAALSVPLFALAALSARRQPVQGS